MNSMDDLRLCKTVIEIDGDIVFTSATFTWTPDCQNQPNYVLETGSNSYNVKGQIKNIRIVNSN